YELTISQGQPPAYARLRDCRRRRWRRAVALGVGRRAAVGFTQLSGGDDPPRWATAYDAGVGALARQHVLFQHRTAIAEGSKPGRQSALRGLDRPRRRGGDPRRSGRRGRRPRFAKAVLRGL